MNYTYKLPLTAAYEGAQNTWLGHTGDHLTLVGTLGEGWERVLDIKMPKLTY
jgi:hypothetical protein